MLRNTDRKMSRLGLGFVIGVVAVVLTGFAKRNTSSPANGSRRHGELPV